LKLNANNFLALSAFMKTAPGQEPEHRLRTAEIQAGIIFGFFDEMATETSLKREDIEF